VDRIYKAEQTSLESPMRLRRKRKNEALYNILLGGKLDHLPLEERQITLIYKISLFFLAEMK